MEDSTESNDLVVETFYNSSSSFIGRIVGIVDKLSKTKHVETVDIAELLKLVGGVPSVQINMLKFLIA